MSIDLLATAGRLAPSRTSATPQRATFRSIEAERGIAALLVVLFHADKVMLNPAYWHAHVFGGLLVAGHAGVEFFFVLSGFIIAHVHAADIGRPERLRRYVTRRFERIYPLYWLVLTGVVALAVLGPDVNSLRHVDNAAIASSYLLAGTDSHGGALTVSWTLFHEVLFYLAFAVLIVDRSAGIAIGAVWAGLIVAAATVGVGGLPAYVTSPLNLLFAAGALAQIAVRTRRIRHPLLWAVIGIASFFALGVEEAWAPMLPGGARDLLYGLASAIALAGIVSRECDRPMAVPAPLSMLGAASYSIYLVHFPALSVVARVMRRAGLTGALPAELGCALLVTAVVVLGIALHVAVERPLLAWLGQHRGAPRVARPATLRGILA